MRRQGDGQSFSALCERRFSRRDALHLLGAAGVGLAGVGIPGCSTVSQHARGSASPLTFREIEHRLDETHHVAPGYDARILLSWGDPLFAGAPAFNADRQSADSQLAQFGYNNDFLAYFPFDALTGRGRPPRLADGSSNRGLLCVNHEYTSAYLMFPGYQGWKDSQVGLTQEQIRVEMAAHGHTVVEVERDSEQWRVINGAPLNRRISMFTLMSVSGPAAGHRRLQTKDDPSGHTVIGTMGNCAGGVAPWGTVLIAEENFRYNFGGDPAHIAAMVPEEARNHSRFGFGGHERRAWYRVEDRFHIEREPREPNRFGWMVEFDPYDPRSRPRKLTALGRFQHEGCSVVAEPGKPVVVYMGDDGVDEYLYRYVSSGTYDPNAGTLNSRLFEDGILYVARLYDDGTAEWLPLQYGDGLLTPDNGFHDQGDVMIDTRLAADLLGATPMDRPEDVEVNPVTGRVYAMLTKNTDRSRSDGANPRTKNRWGHIVEMLPPGEDGRRDHHSNRFEWDLFLLAGDPAGPAGQRGRYGVGTSNNGWFCNPDNLAFDPEGRIWMATDNDSKFGFHDGLWAAQTLGPDRAVSRHFFGCPRGAELCGPCFTPDGRTLFVAVQHPADGSTFLDPSTRWPDFRDGVPPRPSVVAITHREGKTIGS